MSRYVGPTLEWLNRTLGTTFGLAQGETGSGGLVRATSPTLTTPIIGSYTFATLPSAASNSGALAWVSDIGGYGTLFRSNGTRWTPVGGRAVLAATGTAVTAPGDTNENILATVTVRGNLMGTNDSLRVASSWNYTNSANSKTLRHRLGGIGGTDYLVRAETTSNTVVWESLIANANATNSQVGSRIANPVGSVPTGTVDMTADTTLVITGQKASGGETLTLRSYVVELISGS